MNDLLVIVDMVNGFVNFGLLADIKINKITPNIIELINYAQNKKIDIVAFKDSHDIQDVEFKVFLPHCIKGTEESDLIPELKAYENMMQIIEKNTTNGFITKEFKELLKREFRNVYVCGCCTDICVSGFVLSYLRYIKEENKNTKIYVIDDACYTFDSDNHNALDSHNHSLNLMKENGAIIIKTEDIVK